MANITTVRVWANNEVAYIAWDIDEKIPGCLGFDIVRVVLNADGTVRRRNRDGQEDRDHCATWVAFEGQRNPLWLPQDTSVWPVQKLSWRDLTLRKKRDGMTRRPDEIFVRYEIRPVGDLKPGMEPVSDTNREFQLVKRRDTDGVPLVDEEGKFIWERVRAYEGRKRTLGYLAEATISDAVKVTSVRGKFRSTFTNGILAAQWLTNVLNDDGIIQKNELIEKISNPDDVHRKYLAGDVIPLIRELFDRPGEFYLALYELEDKELEDILVTNAARIHVILSNTAAGADGVWDERNANARQRLIDADVDIQHRMFNNSTHIGHNKFVVHVPDDGTERSVLTGSTNWTSTGLAGQTNNALLITDNDIADEFLNYWERMKADELPLPGNFGDELKDNQQGAQFRADNAVAREYPINGGSKVKIWFSPNRPERRKSTSKKNPPPVPPDLAELYNRMRTAKEAILFLAFYPGQSGKDCIIGQAIDIGINDPSLIVAGAVSSPQAMPNFNPKKKDKGGNIINEGASPHTFENGNVSIVRAARIDDKTILGDLGVEQLTAKGGIGAIIHDKLVVVDPLSPDCMVMLGSHNAGFKASYSNDENMLLVTGDQELAAAYAVHILDVYDHYKFRAIEAELKKQGKEGWSGFLKTEDSWQDGYVEGRKGALMRYFARS
jgi:phosphatidylserine/phosphatidylglycerophosphate/cardiolipin synthase-like enzyme